MESDSSATRLSFLSDQRTVTDTTSHVLYRSTKLREIDSKFLLQIAAPVAELLNFDKESDQENPQSDPMMLHNNSNERTSSFRESSSFLGPNISAEYHGRVLIVGPSASGKSTLKQMIREDKFWFSDVQPSLCASTSPYHFIYTSGNRPTEKLIIDLVDTGPIQRSGLARFYAPADLIVMTWSLATVKQVKVRTGLLSTSESVVFHPREIEKIASAIRDLTIALPGTPVIVFGTHKDVLSDQSSPSVERVVQQLQKIVSDAIDAASFGELQLSDSAVKRRFAPLVLLGCFAVSRSESKCIGSGGGSNPSMSSLWKTMCESVLKGARASPVIRQKDLPKLIFFDSFKQFNSMVSRVSKFLNCLRAEHGIALLGLHQLTQALFAFATPSKTISNAVLQVLIRRGEAVLLPRTREYSKQVLLMPQLPSRIVSAILSVASAMKYPVEERILPKTRLINIDECLAADPPHELAQGLLRMAVVNCLSACIPSEIAQDRQHVFLRVARQIGLLFKLGDSTPSSPLRQSSMSNASFSSSSQLHMNTKFIVPMFLALKLAPSSISVFERECVSGRVHSAARQIALAAAPSAFITLFQCELGCYVKSLAHVTRNSIWLSKSTCRAIVSFDRDAVNLPDKTNIIIWFFAATGDDSVREFALFIQRVMRDITKFLEHMHLHDVAKISTSNPKNPFTRLIVSENAIMALGEAPMSDSAAAILRLDLTAASLGL